MPSKNDRDRELIERIKSGDKKAVSELYEDNWPMIKKMVLNNSGNYEDAEDIFLEGFIVVHDNILNGKFYLKGVKISTYVYAVCRKKWLKIIETKNIQTNKFKDYFDWVIIDDAEIGVDEESPYKNIMYDALNRISEICKKLILNRHFHRKSHQQLAIEFNYANANVCKATLDRCMNNARSLAADILRDYYNNEI